MGAASVFPLLRPAPPNSRTLATNSKSHRPPCRVAVNPARRRGGGFPVFAGANGNGLSKGEALPKVEEPVVGGGGGEKSDAAASGTGDDGGQGTGKKPPRRRAATMAGIRWRELLLDPDPDNVLAVGLTGILAWASVQVLWQLLVISLAILLAAVKYSFIAALLLFIIITLL